MLDRSSLHARTTGAWSASGCFQYPCKVKVQAAIRSALDAFAAEAAALSSHDVLKPDALSILAERLFCQCQAHRVDAASEKLDVLFYDFQILMIPETAAAHVLVGSVHSIGMIPCLL